VKSTTEVNSGQVEVTTPEAESRSDVSDVQASRKMTFAENVIATVKVLAVFGLLGVALWAVDLWTSG
jgi:hypothetical protein